MNLPIINQLESHFKKEGTYIARYIAYVAKPEKISKRIFLHVQTGDRNWWMVKIAFYDDPLLKLEIKNLSYLENKLAGSDIKRTVPRLSYSTDNLFIQTILSGTSIERYLASNFYFVMRHFNLEKKLSEVIGWLIKFHEHTKISGNEIGNCIGGYHGDFKPSNILLDPKQKISIIDWELYEKNGYQIYDLFHFITQTGIILLKQQNKEKRIKQILNDENKISKLLRNLLFYYVSKRKLSANGLQQSYVNYLKFILNRRAQLGLYDKEYYILDIIDYIKMHEANLYLFADFSDY